MDYRELLKEENDSVALRFELARDRVAEIFAETEGDTVCKDAGVCAYFHRTAAFLKDVYEVYDARDRKLSLAELEERNLLLYGDILPEHYAESFANPAYATKVLGEELGTMLCMVYGEIRGLICAAFECRVVYLTIFSELFISLYNALCDPEPDLAGMRDNIYWFYHDYSELFVEQQVEETVNPALTFAVDIVMESDLLAPDYLYAYGEYVGETERRTAAFLNTFSEEEIDTMARTYTEGYRKGFALAGIDLSKKKTVNIRYNLGFERMVKSAIRQFADMGLTPIIYRATPSKFIRSGMARIGYTSVSPNRQYDYDHKEDAAFYLDRAILNRRLEELTGFFEERKELAAGHAGPAVIEIFGEDKFEPVNCPQALSFDGAQQQLVTEQAVRAGAITNTYIPGDERSFTIIAYPVYTIGPAFEEIFAETVRINNLDYEKYAAMQQHLIDALDRGKSVHVTGKNGNYTDITVQLYPLRDPSQETCFENCVADVNIPVGEVFTSPVLQGTNGTLYVSQVYLNGLEFRDLFFTLEDGWVKDYGCSNFRTPEENRAYIEENILHHFDSLPLGEFAIGTNTTAYRMGRDYGIVDQLPILIAEKTGPHFAVGDTCYSHAEDVKVYNPDGKEIVARENEVARLRDKAPEKAYFNCHTDVTIPFAELDRIVVLDEKGEELDVLIENGRFVLPGTEALNEPLDR